MSEYFQRNMSNFTGLPHEFWLNDARNNRKPMRNCFQAKNRCGAKKNWLNAA